MNDLLIMLESPDFTNWEFAVDLITNYKQNELGDKVMKELSDYFDKKIEEGDLRYSKTLYKENYYHLLRVAIVLDEWKKSP